MSVELSPELQEFVQSRVASGAYGSESAVIEAALKLLAQREKLLADIDAGKRQLDRGEYTEYDEQSLSRFLSDIEAESRRILMAQRVP